MTRRSGPASAGSTQSVGNATDKLFAGSIPTVYETHLVPLIFQAYADDLARRLASRPMQRVLEIAAGTGVVTRALSAALPEPVVIVATDLNQAMLDHAIGVGSKRPVVWRLADAMPTTPAKSRAGLWQPRSGSAAR